MRGRIARVIAVRQTLWKENLIYREGFFFFWNALFIIVYWGKTQQGQK